MAITIEDFMQTATGEQKDLLFKLSGTAEKEKKLAEEIKKIYDSIKSGAYSSDGFSITPCEDEEDALLISANPRQKLKEIREQMKGYMKEAINLRMDNLGIIQRNYEHYTGEPLPTN